MTEESGVPKARITLFDGELNNLIKRGRGKALWSIGSMSNFQVDFYEYQVRSYYEGVDQSDFKSVFRLFSGDVEDNRCDLQIKGMNDFKKFYSATGNIQVEHTLKDVLATQGIVFVRGSYKGTQDNDSIDVEFADFFMFNPQGKIEERCAYLQEENIENIAEQIEYMNIARMITISNGPVIAAETLIRHDGQVVPLFAEFARLEGDKIKEGYRYLGLGIKLIK